MTKKHILIVALVIMAVAVAVAVAVDGNQAAAFQGGFSAGCQTCHASGTAQFPHTIAAHAYPTSSCANCHTNGTGAGTADIGKCATCHDGAIAMAAVHGTSCTSCHAAATTTTSSSTTTSASSTTTAPPTTSTSLTTTTTSGAPRRVARPQRRLRRRPHRRLWRRPPRPRFPLGSLTSRARRATLCRQCRTATKDASGPTSWRLLNPLGMHERELYGTHSQFSANS